MHCRLRRLSLAAQRRALGRLAALQLALEAAPLGLRVLGMQSADDWPPSNLVAAIEEAEAHGVMPPEGKAAEATDTPAVEAKAEKATELTNGKVTKLINCSK